MKWPPPCRFGPTRILYMTSWTPQIPAQQHRPTPCASNQHDLICSAACNANWPELLLTAHESHLVQAGLEIGILRRSDWIQSSHERTIFNKQVDPRRGHSQVVMASFSRLTVPNLQKLLRALEDTQSFVKCIQSGCARRYPCNDQRMPEV